MVGINIAITLFLLILIAFTLLTLIYLVSKELLSLLFSGYIQRKKTRLRSLIWQLDMAGEEKEKKVLRESIEKSKLGSTKVILEMIPQTARETKNFLVAILEERGLVKKYVRSLGEKNSKRAEAVEVLGLIGAAVAVPSLFKLLNNSNPAVRQKVAKALAEIGDERAIAPLLSQLREPQWGELSEIATAVLSFGKKAESQVLELLDDSSSTARYWAAEILGKLKSKRAVEGLTKSLKDEKANIRAKSANALGEIKDLRVLDALAKACSDKSWFVRENAVEALGNILEEPQSPSDTSFIVSILVFLLGDREWVVREKAAEALLKGDRFLVVPSLTKSLSQDDRKVAYEAAEMLGRLRAKAAFGALVTSLEADDPNLRAAAAEALGKLEDLKATFYLIPLLDDGEWFVQERVAKALGELGDRKALDALYKATTSKNWWVRSRAKQAVKIILQKTEMKSQPVS